ncbi:MAG: OadG family transporter subunit [Anaerolineae bacterium]|jgi:Na+-transporting methylmalonyl-CoA/oxaloacetate decarboxylase gamma subunit|nr:hypothetical protein [Chloroflexota bacterium]
MSTFEVGLEVTGIGMLLVFLSLLVVAGLIWALNKLFPGHEDVPEAEPERVTVPAVEAGPVPEAGASLADEAAAIAVALVRQAAAAVRTAPVALAPAQSMYPAMPWERPAEMWGEDLLQGETTVVINVDPGTGNWKCQGRLASMQ